MLTNIEKVNIDPDLPLLICDADEVIFQFMEAFELYLASNNLFFSYKSFKWTLSAAGFIATKTSKSSPGV